MALVDQIARRVQARRNEKIAKLGISGFAPIVDNVIELDSQHVNDGDTFNDVTRALSYDAAEKHTALGDRATDTIRDAIAGAEAKGYTPTAVDTGVAGNYNRSLVDVNNIDGKGHSAHDLLIGQGTAVPMRLDDTTGQALARQAGQKYFDNHDTSGLAEFQALQDKRNNRQINTWNEIKNAPSAFMSGGQQLLAGVGDLALTGVSQAFSGDTAQGLRDYFNDAKDAQKASDNWGDDRTVRDYLANDAGYRYRTGDYSGLAQVALTGGVGALAESLPAMAALFVTAPESLVAGAGLAVRALSKVASGYVAVSLAEANNQLEQREKLTGKPNSWSTATAVTLESLAMNALDKMSIKAIVGNREVLKPIASKLPESVRKSLAGKIVGNAGKYTAALGVEGGTEYVQSWMEILGVNLGANGQTASDIFSNKQNQDTAIGGGVIGAGAGGHAHIAAHSISPLTKGVGLVSSKLNSAREKKAAFEGEGNMNSSVQYGHMTNDKGMEDVLSDTNPALTDLGFIRETTNPETGEVEHTTYNPIKEADAIIREYEAKRQEDDTQINEIFNNEMDDAQAQGEDVHKLNPDDQAAIMHNTLGAYTEKMSVAISNAEKYIKALMDKGDLTKAQITQLKGHLLGLEQRRKDIHNDTQHTYSKYYNEYLKRSDDPELQAKAIDARMSEATKDLTKNIDFTKADIDSTVSIIKDAVASFRSLSDTDSSQRTAAEATDGSINALTQRLRDLSEEKVDSTEKTKPSTKSNVSDITSKLLAAAGNADMSASGPTPSKSTNTGKGSLHKKLSSILFGESTSKGLLRHLAIITRAHALMGYKANTSSNRVLTQAKHLDNSIAELTALKGKVDSMFSGKDAKDRQAAHKAISDLLLLAKTTQQKHATAVTKAKYQQASKDIVHMSSEHVAEDNNFKLLASSLRLHFGLENDPNYSVEGLALKDTLVKLLDKALDENTKQSNQEKVTGKRTKVTTTALVKKDGTVVNISSFVKIGNTSPSGFTAFNSIESHKLPNHSDLNTNTGDLNTEEGRSEILKAIEEQAKADGKKIASEEDLKVNYEEGKSARVSLFKTIQKLIAHGKLAFGGSYSGSKGVGVKGVNTLYHASKENKDILKALKLLLNKSTDGKLNIPDNVLLATATGALEYIKTSGSSLNYRSDDDVLTAFNISYVPNDFNEANAFNKLRMLGVPQSVVAQEIGRVILKSLNLKMSDGAPSTLEGKLEVSLGGLAIEMLVREGIVERKSISTPDLNELVVDAGGTRANIDNMKSKSNFIKLIQDDSVETLRDDLKYGSPVFATILGDSYVPRKTGASATPYDGVKGTITKGVKSVKGFVSKLLDVATKTKYVFNKDLMDKVFTDGKLDYGKSVDIINEVTGLPNLTAEVLTSEEARTKWAEDNFVEGLRDIKKSTLEGEIFNLQKVETAVNALGGYAKAIDKPFYLRRIVWKQGRIGIESSDINIQESILHRTLAHVEGTHAKVTDARSRYNLLSLAVQTGLDEKADYQTFLNKQDAIHKDLTLASYDSDVLKASKKYLVNPSKEALSALVEAIGDKYTTLNEAIGSIDKFSADAKAKEVANSILNVENPKHTFERTYNIEVDGITNGFGLSLMSNPIFSDPEKTLSYLAKVGVHFYADKVSNKEAKLLGAQGARAKNPDFKDSYETLGGVLAGLLGSLSPETIDTFSTLFPKTFDIKDSLIEIARNFSKNPFMIYNYGSAIGNIKRKVKANLHLGLLEDISGAYRDSDIGRLRAIHKALVSNGLISPRITAESFIKDPRGIVIDTAGLNELTHEIAEAMGKTIESQIGELDKPRQIVNASFNAQMKIFQQIWKFEKEKMLEASEDGELTVSQVNDLKRIMEPFIPRFNSIDAFISGKGKDRSSMEGVPAFKLKKSKDAFAILELDFDGLNQSSFEISTSAKELEEAGVSGYVLMVHNMDGHIMNTAINKIVESTGMTALDVHDAIKANASQVEAFASALNEATVEVISKYSIINNSLQALEGSLNSFYENYQEHFGNDPENTVRAIHKIVKDVSKDEFDLFKSIKEYNDSINRFNDTLDEQFKGGSVVVSQYAGVAGLGNTVHSIDSLKGTPVDTSKLEFLYRANVKDTKALDDTYDANNLKDVSTEVVDKIKEVTASNVLDENSTLADTFRLVSSMLEASAGSDSARAQVVSLILAMKPTKAIKKYDDALLNKLKKQVKGKDVLDSKDTKQLLETVLTDTLQGFITGKNDYNNRALNELLNKMSTILKSKGLDEGIGNADSSATRARTLAKILTNPEIFSKLSSMEIGSREALLKKQPTVIATPKKAKEPVLDALGKPVVPEVHTLFTHIRNRLAKVFKDAEGALDGFKSNKERSKVNVLGELLDALDLSMQSKVLTSDGTVSNSNLRDAAISMRNLDDTTISNVLSLQDKFLKEGNC